MKTQQQQIKRAKFAYLVPLNTTWTRWAVYLDRQGRPELYPLWPSDCHERNSKELLPGQIYSKATHFPAYHFHLTGCGYSKKNEIASTLKQVNPALVVMSGLESGCILRQETEAEKE